MNEPYTAMYLRRELALRKSFVIFTKETAES
jgi:hypothetical protein